MHEYRTQEQSAHTLAREAHRKKGSVVEGLRTELGKAALSRVLREYGKESADSYQIASRLKSLLPDRFQILLEKERIAENSLIEQTAKPKAYIARLKVLTSPSYNQLITEIEKTNHIAHKSRIQWETNSMLFKAKQSINAWHVALEKKNRI